jgi:hypothetical protein
MAAPQSCILPKDAFLQKLCAELVSVETAQAAIVCTFDNCPQATAESSTELAVQQTDLLRQIYARERQITPDGGSFIYETPLMPSRVTFAGGTTVHEQNIELLLLIGGFFALLIAGVALSWLWHHRGKIKDHSSSAWQHPVRPPLAKALGTAATIALGVFGGLALWSWWI